MQVGLVMWICSGKCNIDVDSYCNCKVVYHTYKVLLNNAVLVETSAIKRVSCKHKYIVITVHNPSEASKLYTRLHDAGASSSVHNYDIAITI